MDHRLPLRNFTTLNRQWHQLKFNTCGKSWIDDADGGDHGDDDDDDGDDGNHGDDEDEVERLSCSEQIYPVTAKETLNNHNDKINRDPE